MKKRKTNDFVDGWRLNKILGKGGNAQVWAASKDNEKDIALKILNSTSLKSEPYKRFKQEILSHQKLIDDPGVMPLLNYSLPKNPSFESPAWLAMPIAIQSDIFHTNSTLFEIVEFVWKISETLLRCASKKVYHRDIKPANLYLLNDFPVVGDFGLAHIPERQALTQSGRKFGPIFYLPDEMLNEAGSADPAPADVFMLAKTLWVLASGQKYPPQGQIQTKNELSCLNMYWNDQKTHMLDEIMECCTCVDFRQRPTMSDLSNELSAWLDYDVDRSHSTPDLTSVGSRLKPLIENHLFVAQRAETNKSDVDRLQRVIAEKLSDMGNMINVQTNLKVEITYDNHINSVVNHPESYNVKSCGPSVNIVAEVAKYGCVNCGFFVSGVGFMTSENMKTISLIGAHAIRGVDEKLLWSKQVDIIPNSAYEKVAISEIIEGLWQSLNVSLTEYADHLSKYEFIS